MNVPSTMRNTGQHHRSLPHPTVRALLATQQQKITMLVRRVILSEYSGDLPDDPDRAKVPGPLYSLKRVQGLIALEFGLTLMTRRCISDAAKYFDSDLTQIVDIVAALRSDDYIDSEWCHNGKGGYAACDAYAIEGIDTVGDREIRVEYFFKFAISKAGKVVLLFSCHLSQ